MARNVIYIYITIYIYFLFRTILNLPDFTESVVDTSNIFADTDSAYNVLFLNLWRQKMKKQIQVCFVLPLSPFF